MKQANWKMLRQFKLQGVNFMIGIALLMEKYLGKEGHKSLLALCFFMEASTTNAALTVLRRSYEANQLLEIRCTITGHRIPSLRRIPGSVRHKSGWKSGVDGTTSATTRASIDNVV